MSWKISHVLSVFGPIAFFYLNSLYTTTRRSANPNPILQICSLNDIPASLTGLTFVTDIFPSLLNLRVFPRHSRPPKHIDHNFKGAGMFALSTGLKRMLNEIGITTTDWIEKWLYTNHLLYSATPVWLMFSRSCLDRRFSGEDHMVWALSTETCRINLQCQISRGRSWQFPCAI